MNTSYLRDKIFHILNFEFSGQITFVDTDNVYAKYDGNNGFVGGKDASSLCRALMEFAKGVSEGRKEYEIIKKQQFKYCGSMLDMSRRGVLRVESVKKYIEYMAVLGMNMLMLYTEDMFEMRHYPYFGYKRGRYTISELQEIDDYANSFGIEVIPCIQTLGHLNQYLAWAAAAPVKDTPFNVIPDEEITYQFIEEMLKTMKQAFRSNKIHIGMDEVIQLGTGEYYRKHRNEPINQKEIFYRHLSRVCKMCKEYSYEPIIWSDLIFSLPYPDERKIFREYMEVPDEDKKSIPDNLRLMYWYYSSTSKEKYANLLKNHRNTGRKTAFAGSGWNWESFAPNYKYNFDCTIPALEACIEDKTEMVLNTLWGDNGCETPFFLCFPSNALYAEYFYNGKEANGECAWEYCEFVTGSTKKCYDAMDKLHYGLKGCTALARKLLRQDILGELPTYDEGFLTHNIPDEIFIGNEPMETYRSSAEELEAHVLEYGDWNEYYILLATVLRTAAFKAEVHIGLRKAYKENNIIELKRFKNDIFPRMLDSYKKLHELHRQQWMREYKMFGWKFHCMVFGDQVARIEYASLVIDDYLASRIDIIEELEPEQLNQNIIEYDTDIND